jgi:hypothetical protein
VNSDHDDPAILPSNPRVEGAVAAAISRQTNLESLVPITGTTGSKLATVGIASIEASWLREHLRREL